MYLMCDQSVYYLWSLSVSDLEGKMNLQLSQASALAYRNVRGDKCPINRQSFRNHMLLVFYEHLVYLVELMILLFFIN